MGSWLVSVCVPNAADSRETYRYRNGHVDANLTGLNLTLEAASGRTRASEDGGTVTVLVGIDHVNGFVDGLDVQADKDRAKNLLSVALHMRLDVGDDGRTNLQSTVSAMSTSHFQKTYPVAVGVLVRRGLLTTSVKEDSCSLLLGARNEVFNPLLRLWADNRPEIRTLLEATVHGEFFCALGDFRDPVLGLTDHD